MHDPDPTWSDRCYFFAASPDGTLLLASPATVTTRTPEAALGYVKVSLADGRHWDLLSGRPITGDDRGDLARRADALDLRRATEEVAT